jgi:uncharacterized small protein (DUF1192 family)
MDIDDNDVKKAEGYQIGSVLDALSIDELQSQIKTLEDEILRIKSAIKNKNATRSAADAVFNSQ